MAVEESESSRVGTVPSYMTVTSSKHTKIGFEENLKRAVIFGDDHFTMAKVSLDDSEDSEVNLLTPISKLKFKELREDAKENEDGEGLVKLTKDEEKWNADLAQVRARIEKSFG